MIRTTALLAVLSVTSPAQEEAPDAGAAPAGEFQLPPLEWRTGTNDIRDGLATLELGDGFRMLGPADTRTVLEDIWGNPPDPSVLGMVFPADLGPIDDGNWAVIITYEEDGYVEDDDAADLDYDDLLETMQEDTEAANEQRQRMGYGTMELLGWAEPPHYDAETKKLYWAKKLMFEGSDAPTLNYNVRILGRRGVLVLNAVGHIDQLALVAAGCKDLLTRTRFTDGNRYEDFDPSIDKIAAYGIGGLIAGKVLAKAGLFKALLAFLKVGIKPILVGLALLAGVVMKFLGGRKTRTESGAAGGE